MDNLSENEHKILKFWEENDIYKKLVDRNKGRKLFRFMDGPPFVSSDKLHNGHVHIGYIKSTVIMYQHMHGYDVLNMIGYDCHGLPIEMEVNKMLNISSNKDVEELGIANYNKKCKEVIKSYSGSWQDIYKRIGRWVDFTNEYKTMDTPFMETVWWVFSQLWKKNLVYNGYRITAYSTACGTPLSNFEASGKDNYRTVTDPSVYIKFKLVDEECYIVAWTTTPWTLPSNLALAVNSSFKYVKIKDSKTDNYYIVAQNTEKKLFKKNSYTIVDSFNGDALVGKSYEPVFNYFSDREFKILSAEYVTCDNGTGVVHLAPAFGEDDFNTCINNNIVTTNTVGDFCPVDQNGHFTSTVSDYTGLHVLKTNRAIINRMKEEDKLIKEVPYTHSYPFCWRTDTPLIYMAVPSFFINVTSLKDKLIENNKKVNWTPSHVGTGQFHQWLSNARDWGVSRSRFFGTPIPVWVSDDGEEIVCVGSIDELVELSGVDTSITDLHRENIDHITIQSKKGKGVLRRVDDVFDCWFESGAVPFGQIHYPFENREVVDNVDFMSDFVCEAIDQTRGWFYTLTVLSTALFDKPPFKNVICSGHIVGADGKKISKRLGNYIPPKEMVEEYSADGLRMYFVSSPAAHAEKFKLKVDDVSPITKKFVQLINSFRYFVEYSTDYESEGYTLSTTEYSSSTNICDIWILSRTSSTVSMIEEEMKEFKVFKVWSYLSDYIEDLTNWYIKINRDRMKGKLGKEEQGLSLSVLYNALLSFSVVSAPFIPFLSETLYQQLSSRLVNPEISVHFAQYSNIPKYCINENTERKMKRLQQVVVSIRIIRSKNNLTLKMPLKEVNVCHNDEQYLNDIREVEQYLKEESNSLNIVYSDQKGKVLYSVTPVQSVLGKKYRTNSRDVCKMIRNIDSSTVEQFINKESDMYIQFKGVDVKLESDEFTVNIRVSTDIPELSTYIDGKLLTVVDTTATPEVVAMYRKKLFVRTVQEMRAEAGLHPWDKISIFYSSVEDIENVLTTYKDMIENDLMYSIHKKDVSQYGDVLIDKSTEIDGHKVDIVITTVCV